MLGLQFVGLSVILSMLQHQSSFIMYTSKTYWQTRNMQPSLWPKFEKSVLLATSSYLIVSALVRPGVTLVLANVANSLPVFKWGVGDCTFLSKCFRFWSRVIMKFFVFSSPTCLKCKVSCPWHSYAVTP